MRRLLIDCGGTYIRSQLWEGEVCIRELSSSKRPLMQYINECLESDQEVKKVFISYAGQVDGGKILSAPNIVIDEPNIVDVIQSRYNVEVWIDNDLNCAALAEAEVLKCDTIAVMYVGTGLGAAVIDRGKIVRGEHNSAFELGHIPYRKSNVLCGCGRDNCIEIFASGSGIAKRLAPFDALPLEVLKHSPDVEKRQIALDFEEALLHACGVLVTVANPKILVLGGGIVKNNPYLADLVRTNLDKVAMSASIKGLRIELSHLDNGSLQGAKLLEYTHEN